jgi:hypothetical protein
VPLRRRSIGSSSSSSIRHRFSSLLRCNAAVAGQWDSGTDGWMDGWTVGRMDGWTRSWTAPRSVILLPRRFVCLGGFVCREGREVGIRAGVEAG